jgi:N-acetylmuramic acid 6-phosphate etherase
MVNMQLTNSKLVDRGTKMVMEKTGINSYDKARELLLKYGSVKKAVDSLESGRGQKAEGRDESR